MKRRILAVVLGLVAWMVVATACDRLLRAAWPDYANALPTFAFSLGMLFARLRAGAPSIQLNLRASGRGGRPTPPREAAMVAICCAEASAATQPGPSAVSALRTRIEAAAVSRTPRLTAAATQRAPKPARLRVERMSIGSVLSGKGY